MKSIWSVCVCLAVVGAVVGCESKSAEVPAEVAAETPPVADKAEAPAAELLIHPLPGDPVAGEAVYTKVCLACHGADGKGNGGLTGLNFVAEPTRLNKTNEELLTSIRDGFKGKNVVMPAHKDTLTDKEMKDALSYVRKRFGRTE